ncbi:MAG: phosphate ABC transporter substrate-binding protein PstS family protein [Candidatus Heimdallarchaeota archaeon]|nr:phosphate ABC transporter substrate-binding protein PstS family protein [Candidatus Heimdallarchaeota archaeon]
MLSYGEIQTMSFGKQTNLLTIILIILIPVAGATGFLITWGVMRGGGASTEINVEGSTTVWKIMETSHQEFMAAHPSVTVTVSATGSGSGITALIDGQCDVAMASRPFKPEENTAAGGELTDFAIAKDGLAIIINSAADPLDVTIEEARQIFNGEITSWSDPEVSDAGLTGDIQVVVRESGSGTRDTFNDIVMGDEDQVEPGSQYVSGALEKTSNQLIKDAVAENENYIGYVGLGYVSGDVEAVSIGGVAPSKATVVDDSYPVARSLFLITIGEPEGMVKEFINFHFSPTCQYIVEDVGFIAVGTKWDEL